MLSIVNELHEILGFAAVIVAVGAGLLSRRPAYRWAAGVIILETLFWLSVSGLLNAGDRLVLGHAKAFAVTGLLAWGVWRHESWGLILLLALQLVAVFVHLALWFEASIPSSVNALVLNAVGWLMMATLFAGAAASSLRREPGLYGTEQFEPRAGTERGG